MCNGSNMVSNATINPYINQNANANSTLPGPNAKGGGNGAQFESLLTGAKGGASAEPYTERFLNSQVGGVIVNADGSPGTPVKAGSYLDTTTGKLYGPDGSEVALPKGASVNFFDVADSLEQSIAATAGGPPAGKGGDTAPAKGGGDTPPAKGDTVPVKGGDSSVAGAAGGGTSATGPLDVGKALPAAGAKVDAAPGTSVNSNGVPVGYVDTKGTFQPYPSTTLPDKMAGGAPFQSAAMTGCEGMQGTGNKPGPQPAVGGAMGGGLEGVGALGKTPSLEASLADLVATLTQLVAQLQLAISNAAAGGGAPGKKPVFVPTQVATPIQQTTPTAPAKDSAVDAAAGGASTEAPAKGEAAAPAKDAPVATDETSAPAGGADASDAAASTSTAAPDKGIVGDPVTIKA